jgi:hypothetical protein
MGNVSASEGLHWVDAVEKVADDLGEPFHLAFLGSGFVSVFVFLSGATDMSAGVQLPQGGRH